MRTAPESGQEAPRPVRRTGNLASRNREFFAKNREPFAKNRELFAREQATLAPLLRAAPLSIESNPLTDGSLEIGNGDGSVPEKTRLNRRDEAAVRPLP
jgi:hypothetical protein